MRRFVVDRKPLPFWMITTGRKRNTKEKEGT